MKLSLSNLSYLLHATHVLAGVSAFAWSAIAATPLPGLDIRLKGAWPRYGRTAAQAIVASSNMHISYRPNKTSSLHIAPCFEFRCELLGRLIPYQRPLAAAVGD